MKVKFTASGNMDDINLTPGKEYEVRGQIEGCYACCYSINSDIGNSIWIAIAPRPCAHLLNRAVWEIVEE